jgi:hypothetical protein
MEMLNRITERTIGWQLIPIDLVIEMAAIRRT